MSQRNDDIEKQAEKERRSSAVRGDAFGVLQSQKEWKYVAEIFYRLTDHWKRQLIRFKDTDSIDKIAIERVYWTARISALEDFFRTMQEDMDTAKEFDREAEDREKRVSGDKSHKPVRDTNPFRAQNKNKEDQ